MFGPSLLGQTLAFRPLSGLFGDWGYSLDGEPLAGMHWSGSERSVRAECDNGAWQVLLPRGFLTRAVVSDAADRPRLVYAGGVSRGLSQAREGRRFFVYSRASPREGRWVGVDDLDGDGVLRMRGRTGPGIWSEVNVTPAPVFGRFIVPLLLLVGSLQMEGMARRWRVWTTAMVSERAAQAALEGLVTSAGF
jgi:hypothetical protein